MGIHDNITLAIPQHLFGNLKPRFVMSGVYLCGIALTRQPRSLLIRTLQKYLKKRTYKVKENHKYITKAVYVVLEIQMDGRKDILGVWIGENECAKFWLSVMNDLKNRGVKDVYVFCVDGLTGFCEAINAAFPKSQIQRCIIHQIRSSTRYVSYKDIKSLMVDLKKLYQAINEDKALNALLEFKEKWQKTYPSCVKSWEDNWDILSTFFAYPAEVRKIIYTTNIIEGLNRQFRKITKNKP